MAYFFVSKQHSTEIDFSCKWGRTANTRTPNSTTGCKSSQGKIWPRKNPLERERRLEIQRQQWKRRRQQETGEQRENHSMNFQCSSSFTSKWKRFWIICLKIGAKILIAVIKHVFPYRQVYTVLAQFGFRSLNAMKCVYVGFSLSKQQSFFWKISLNSCLIGLDQLHTGRAGGSSRGKGFKNIFSQMSPVSSLGLVVTIWPGASKVPSSITSRTFFFSLLFFFFSLSFLVIAVLFCFFI